MRQVAIYGKGGIGKSTTTQNLNAGLGEMGKHIMIVGCDPKADSTRLILGGLAQQSVLDTLREEGEDIELDLVLKNGFKGIRCVESGGPEPGVGCAGRGVITAIDLMENQGAYTDDLDFVFFDVLGDVVCGGFAMPIREGYAEQVFVITSGENMAIHAAANIAEAVKNFASRGYAVLGGIVLNRRNVPREEEKVAELAADIGSKIVGTLDFSRTVQEADERKKTVLEAFPESEAAAMYRNLAKQVIEECGIRS